MARPRNTPAATDGANDNGQDNAQDQLEQATPVYNAPDLGHNKEYTEYRVDDVKPIFRPTPGGGQEVYKYTGLRGRALRTKVRIEQFRADRQNDKWFTTKKVLLAADDTTDTFETIVKN